MSSTPPRKGKKRQAPQTPSGKPPAKASRPSSPDPDTWTDAGSIQNPKLVFSVPPAIPPFRPKATTSGSSRTPPTPTRASSATPMIEDPRPPTAGTDPITFTTVEEDIDDEEAASSFKELLDWMRFLAQHEGQHRRLLNLLTTAASSLQDLRGSVGIEKPATYAAA